MACEIIHVDGAVFVLWGAPTRADLDCVFQRVQQVASAAGPIVFVARIPHAAPAPDASVRKYMDELMPRFVELCASYHVVLEGSGFMATVKRAILTGLFQLGFRSGTFFVHEGGSDVLVKISAASQRARAQALLALASSRGLLTAAPPT